MLTGAALFGGAWSGAPSARLPRSRLSGRTGARPVQPILGHTKSSIIRDVA